MMKKIFLGLLVIIVIIIGGYYADLIPLVPVYQKQALYEPLIFLKSNNKLRVVVTNNKRLLKKRGNEGYFQIYSETSNTDEHTQEDIKPKIFSLPHVDPDSFELLADDRYYLKMMILDIDKVYAANPGNWQFDVDYNDLVFPIDFDREGLRFINSNFLVNQKELVLWSAGSSQTTGDGILNEKIPLSGFVKEVENILSCEDVFQTQRWQETMRDKRRYLIMDNDILVMNSENRGGYALGTIENIDIDKFSLFSCRSDVMYSTDGQKVRYEDQEIVGANPETFEIVDPTIPTARDKNNMYEKGVIVENNTSSRD